MATINTQGGFVYLIENTETMEYKIGLTQSSPEKRVKQLQTGSPARLELRATYKSKYPHRLETLLHRTYSTHRLSGEWFALTQEQVNNFLAKCKETDEIIEMMKDNPFFGKNLC